MAVIDRIDVFTQAMNSAFVNAYEAVPDPAPIDVAITEVPSKGRIENYPWFYPPPQLREWAGFRRYAKAAAINYRVPNKVYTSEFEVLNDDLEDDQVGGFKKVAESLARGARNWKGIQCLQTLALGQTTPCFDGSNFFATTHNVGDVPSGGNIVAGTAAGSDGVTHAAVLMFVGNSMVKPLLWQNREGPSLMNDAGTPEAQKVRMSKWWVDLRGAAAFGFWWDAVLIKWSNTPTLAEIQTTLGNAEARLRGFKLPKNLADDVDLYQHGQSEFDDRNLVIVTSTKIVHLMRQALTLSLIAQTENPYKGYAKLIATGYLDNVT